MATESGVKYWKLTPYYPGDEQLPDGLCGTDLDGNFHFLRGMDVSSISYDKNTLILERLNGDTISCVPSVNGQYILSFEDGTLKIINASNENDFVSISGIGTDGSWLSGVTVDSNTLEGDGTKDNPLSVKVQKVAIYWDTTMKGDGSVSSPMGISPNQKTGFFRPVLSAVTVDNLSAFTQNGNRVLSIESRSDYGLLYTYDMVSAITENILANTGWRIPTEGDYKDLCDPETGGAFVSTFDLKDADAWPSGGSDASGLAFLPTEKTGDIAFSRLWMTTSVSSNTASVVIADNTDTFAFSGYMEGVYGAIRLVRDNTEGAAVDETVEIYGDSFQCISAGDNIWLTTNIGFSNSDITGITVEGSTTKIHYYICEYNGTRWQRKELSEGDSVVIAKNGDAEYHTWRIIGGVLVDVDAREERKLIGEASDATSADTIYGAKAFASQAVSDMSISASGDTYISASVQEKKKVIVSATTDTLNVFAKANSALQTISGSTYVTVTDKGDENKQTISIKTGDVSANTNSIAVASDVKKYVDDGDAAINAKISGLSGVTVGDRVKAGDDSVNVVSSATGTAISVKLSDDEGNIIKLDTHDGLYVNARDLIRYNAGNGIDITSADTINLVLEGTSLVKGANGLKANLIIQAVPSSAITENEVRAEWKLVDKTGVQYGDIIKVYKDSRFIDAILGHVGGSVTGSATSEGYPYTDGTSAIRALQFIFTTKEGAYSMKEVSLDGYLTSDNLGKGLTSVKTAASASTIVDVLIDPSSEDFITASNDGIKLSGIGDAISAAQGSATTVVNLANGSTHLTLSAATASDGHKTYTIGEKNIADRDDTYTKSDINNIVTSITSTMYSVGMSVSPATVFKNTAYSITMSTSFKAFSGNITPSEIHYYDDSSRTHEISSPVSLNLSGSTSQTYYSKVIKDSLTFTSSATVKAYDKVYYGVGASASGVVSSGVYASARASAAGDYTATNGASSTNRFYLCVPAGVTEPTAFTMNGFGATLTRTANVAINGIIYTTFHTDTIGANETVKIKAS